MNEYSLVPAQPARLINWWERLNHHLSSSSIRNKPLPCVSWERLSTQLFIILAPHADQNKQIWADDRWSVRPRPSVHTGRPAINHSDYNGIILSHSSRVHSRPYYSPPVIMNLTPESST